MEYVIKCFLASIQFRRNIDINLIPLHNRDIRTKTKNPCNTYGLVHDRPTVRATIGSWTKQYSNFF